MEIVDCKTKAIEADTETDDTGTAPESHISATTSVFDN